MKIISVSTSIFMVSLALFGTKGHAIQDIQSIHYSLVYSAKESGGRSIFISDEKGNKAKKLVDHTYADGYPAVSPDGKKLAFYGKYDRNKTWSIHTVNIDGLNIRRLTNTKNMWDSSPSWSPDGGSIAFAREYKDATGAWQEEIWLMDADGSNKRQVTSLEGRSPDFMRDGKLLYQSEGAPTQIVMANIDGSNQVRLTHDDSNNMSPKVSPDGTKVAYLSNRDGNQELYMMNTDGSGKTRLTNNDIEDWDPAWSNDGSSIYFSSQNVRGFFDIYNVNVHNLSITKIVGQGAQSARIPTAGK